MRQKIKPEEAVLDAKVFFLRNFFVRYKHLKSKSKQKGQTINLDEIWTAWEEFKEFLKRKRQHGLQPYLLPMACALRMHLKTSCS